MSNKLFIIKNIVEISVLSIVETKFYFQYYCDYLDNEAHQKPKYDVITFLFFLIK